MSSLVAFVSDNAILADPKEREESLRSKVPDLLQPDEKIVFAFKDRGGKGRDSSNLTSKRILIKDKRGLTGKRTDYITIPYDAIRGKIRVWIRVAPPSVENRNSWPDSWRVVDTASCTRLLSVGSTLNMSLIIDML